MTTLSICIPTYNRSRYLAELLESIIAQDLPEVEVVVSDDASTDDTAAIAESFRGRIAKYNFMRQPKNCGLDGNFLAVVEAATGDYIWLMGDDDRLEPGAARRVLDGLRRWPGVAGLTLGVIDYDLTMTRPVGIRKMPEDQLIEDVGTTFNLLAELLGFMSALVIDREKWRSIANDPSVREFANYYIQVYIVGRVIERYGKWGVIRQPCVGFRTGNDQFKTKFGWLQRLKIDVEAYEQIARALFDRDRGAYAAMRRRIFDTHVMARLANAKTTKDPTPGLLSAAAYLFRTYGGMPVYGTRALPMLLAPKWVIRGVRSTYKRLNKSSGAARARALNAD